MTSRRDVEMCKSFGVIARYAAPIGFAERLPMHQKLKNRTVLAVAGVWAMPIWWGCPGDERMVLPSWRGKRCDLRGSAMDIHLKRRFSHVQRALCYVNTARREHGSPCSFAFEAIAHYSKNTWGVSQPLPS